MLWACRTQVQELTGKMGLCFCHRHMHLAALFLEPGAISTRLPWMPKLGFPFRAVHVAYSSPEDWGISEALRQLDGGQEADDGLLGQPWAFV